VEVQNFVLVARFDKKVPVGYFGIPNTLDLGFGSLLGFETLVTTLNDL